MRIRQYRKARQLRLGTNAGEFYNVTHKVLKSWRI